MLHVIMRTPDGINSIDGQSYPTLEVLLPYLDAQSVHLRNPSYPTFTDKVICGLRGKLSHYGGAFR